MESVLNLVVNAENVRVLLILVFGFSGFIWLKTSLEKKIVGVDKRIDELKYNDLAAIHKRIDVLEVTLNKRIDVLEVTLNKRIDEVETSLNGRIDDLKHNDFAHLNSTIEALTYALEKNGSLKLEDKEYVDSRLAR